MKKFFKKIEDIIRSRKNSQSKTPKGVIIETTNRCNLNCPFCLVGRQNDLISKHGSAAHDLMRRPMGHMSDQVFERIRSEIKAFGINSAYLHFQGEPFLNKLTSNFAARLKKDGLYVGVFTNGQAFNDRNVEEIASSNVDLIRFSVDGASEETYQKNRVGGTFHKVFDNMKKVADVHHGKKTRIEWQFLALRNNEHEIEDARLLAKKIGVHFFVKGFRETDPELTPLDPKLRSSFLSKPCKDIYKQLGIYWNGDVVPCCYDVDAGQIMGNIMEQGLGEIWASEKYERFRLNVDNFRNNPSADPDICQSCLRWR